MNTPNVPAPREPRRRRRRVSEHKSSRVQLVSVGPVHEEAKQQQQPVVEIPKHKPREINPNSHLSVAQISENIPRQIRQQKHPPCSKNAYMIFIGQENSGKSTSLNMLFGQREISPVEREEGTSSIMQWSTNFPYGNPNLYLIDVPGLGSMNSLEWDSRVIATFKKFLNSDHELCNNVPNVIIICGRSDDPKLSNPSSSFVKSLQAINLLNARLFDKVSSNVIILMTKFMNAKRTDRNDTTAKLKEIHTLVKKYARFPKRPYVIFGDNEAEDWELEKVVGDSWKLPNGDTYPQNLIDTIIAISKASSSRNISPKFFQSVFDSRKDIQFFNTMNMNLLSISRGRCQKAYAMLESCYALYL